MPVFLDDFSQDLGWALGQSASGSASLLRERLVITANSRGALVQTLAPPLSVEDFLVEVELRAELCEPGDEYGLMFRVNSNLDHYRFTLACEGLARVTRFSRGRDAALVPSTETFAAMPGAPAVNQLTVIAEGGSFQFFINGLDVFAARDFQLPSGGFGVLVWARRSGNTTISVQGFGVYSLAPPDAPESQEGSGETSP